MKLSVVIVNYNVQYFLDICLRSVLKACANIPSEVIVVDNESSDNSCKHVRTHFPDVVLIANTENVGFSKANNIGVASAKGEYVLILNPDTIVGEHTFEEVLDVADTKPDLGALGVQLVDGTGTYLPESKRGIPSLQSTLYKMFGINTAKNTYYANHLSQTDFGKIDVLVGAFMLLKTKIYKQVGGFDEDYFMYGEDIDLSYKLLKAGRQNYYLGSSKIIHFKGESTRKDVRYLKHFHGAMEIFYKKHFKKSFLMNVSMTIGIRLWFLAKYLKLSDAPIIINNRERILYVGKKKISIDKQMHKKLKFIQFNSYKKIEHFIKKNDVEEVWFDASFLSYQQIIKMISEFNSLRTIYKIHSDGTDYVIGSNSSDGRGEIVDLKK